MAVAITYMNVTESWMCVTLQTGDTLGTSGPPPAVVGPAVVYFPVDGSNLNYKQAVAQGLIATATKPARPPKPV
jgi:hypothetical protein